MIKIEKIIKKLVIFAGLSFASSMVYADASVDFSKAYIIPEKSTIDKVAIGGVKPLWTDSFYSVDFSLIKPEYALTVQGALSQSSIKEQLEQNLRNSTWTGNYIINSNNYTTILKLVVVQNGYVGGEIQHGQLTDKEFLYARVTGDIINQYQVNGVFLDEDRIDPVTLNALPINTPTKQLIRIKRVRGIKTNDASNWNTNREYRLILENKILKGSVGIPNSTYGDGDATSEDGEISLTQQN